MPRQCHSTARPRAPLWPDEPGELRQIQPPPRLLVPLPGPGGAEARLKPPGTAVRRGEILVIKPVTSGHVPVAPADGKLGLPQGVQLTNGGAAMAVELLVEGAALPADSSPIPVANPPAMAALATWIDRLRNAGVWADRHNCPDLIGQLNQAVGCPIDTVICTVLDADANLRHNATLAARHGALLASGVSLLRRITGARRGVIALEAGAAAAWTRPVVIPAKAQGLEVVELNNDYPQADPSLMVYTLTRRRLRPGQLPPTRGTLLLDAAAALEVARAAGGEFALAAPLAVHDHSRRQSHLLSVVVGTPLAYVLEQLHLDEEHLTLRGGDLPRDVRLSRQAVIGGAELTIHVTGSELEVMAQPCIRCAWCVEACPTLVQPAAVLEAAQRRDGARARRAGIAACIECGLCSYVCPSRLPLLQAIRQLRAELKPEWRLLINSLVSD